MRTRGVFWGDQPPAIPCPHPLSVRSSETGSQGIRDLRVPGVCLLTIREGTMKAPKRCCIRCGRDYPAIMPDCPSCYDYSYLTELDPFSYLTMDRR